MKLHTLLTRGPATLVLCLVLGVSVSSSAQESTRTMEPIRMVMGCRLSPDGSTMAFEWAGDIWTAPVDGGAATPLTRHPAHERDACFSPDGREIAFVSNREGADQVYTVPVTGGSPTRRTAHSEGYRLLEYAPDGEAFLTLARRDHFWRSPMRMLVVDRAGKSADRAVFDAAVRDGRLSPDGKQVLFSREGTSWFRKGYEGTQASQIWMYDLEQGSYRKLLHDRHGYRYPRWRADGRAFYYVGQQSGTFNLWEYDLATGGVTQLTFFEEDAVYWPEVSRDGSTIVFRHGFDHHRFRPGKDRTPQRIEIHNPGEPITPKEMRRNLTSAGEIAFSNDGLEIAFISGGDLWVMDTELREPRQVTRTPEQERGPIFSPDGDGIYFIGETGGQSDIWRADRKQADRYWWQNDEFTLTSITRDAHVETDLSFSPNGEHLAYVRGLGDLIIMDLESKDPRRFFSSWNRPSYDWSPDGKWIVYTIDDNDFNSDVWIQPLDGSQPAYNISTHPDNDYSPRWSPDGKVIAFTGRRREQEVDIYYVWLRKADDQLDSRDRRLEKALEKMEKERKKKKNKGKKNKKDKEQDPKDDAVADSDAEDKEGAASKKGPEKDLPEVVIDFEGIRDRIRRISIADSRERGLIWIADTKLAFSATIDGERGTYTVEFPDEMKPKKISSTATSRGRWIPEAKQIGLLNRGTPASMSTKGKLTTYSFRVPQELNVADRYRAAFDLAWRSMRDSYYDENFGNNNWDAIRRKYVDIAASAVDDDAFEQVVQLMLGELNGSHLGFRANWGGYTHDQPWSDRVAHLGLRFDPTHRGPGWMVRDVIQKGPTDQAGTEVGAGEIVLAIDGKTIDPSMRVGDVLSGRLDRDIDLLVRAADAEERTVTVRPITFGAARSLLYNMWVAKNRERVSQASGDSLGYLHIRGMNWPSFLRFEEEIYKVGAGKDGLIIDVRANGGGFTTDHLLTVLTQPEHAVTVPRGGGVGYPQDRRIYASWSKPIVVLCDQNSFSNAEIFAHAIRNLGRGQVVGVQTAGGVISTGGRQIMDLGSLRMPFRGWYVLASGEDMELNGALPHHVLWNQPGELTTFRDPQLDRGTAVLLQEVEDWKAKPKPRLQKASERQNRANIQKRTRHF